MSNVLHSVVDKDGFRLRGAEMSRVDAFSDVVFGFALTLLVVSLQVPKTYSELHALLAGFLPFAICFWLLIMLWMEHYQVFRRYGLQDTATIRINAVLLFVILFYVYPLKFMFTMALGRAHEVFSDPRQLRELMVLYGVGFFAFYSLLAMLNYQGWRQRHVLALSDHEQALARFYIADAAIVAAIGLLSCGVAWMLPVGHAGEAGWVYLLAGLNRRVYAPWLKRRLRRHASATRSPEAAE